MAATLVERGVLDQAPIWSRLTPIQAWTHPTQAWTHPSHA